MTLHTLECRELASYKGIINSEGGEEKKKEKEKGKKEKGKKEKRKREVLHICTLVHLYISLYTKQLTPSERHAAGAYHGVMSPTAFVNNTARPGSSGLIWV